MHAVETGNVFKMDASAIACPFTFYDHPARRWQPNWWVSSVGRCASR